MTEDTEQQAKSRTLGLTRWVLVVFMVIGLLLFWMIDKTITLTWSNFAEPNELVSTLVSAVLAGIIASRLYAHEKMNRVTNEVVGELAKVTWPSRQETTSSAVVVIITSIIAAVILGSFDTVWSAITDLIYKA